MIDEREIIRRRDMRDVFTFTIDPADAKDFDDAISFVEVKDDRDHEITGSRDHEKLFQIGVHIADVSHYVKPGTKIDEDAYKRGTSTYLVDRVIPMLPEELCNDLCSLKPGEDKLCMSVVFLVDADARVLKYKICRTVIRSDARLNYDEVQEMITRNPSSPRDPRILDSAILTLNTLASKLRAERLANGALAIEQDEMRFRLDEHYHPTDIYFESPNEAHHLVEEFMLLANRTVAKAVGSGRPFVYRVHDLPDNEKLDDLKKFKKRMGSRIPQQTIDLLTIRAQPANPVRSPAPNSKRNANIAPPANRKPHKPNETPSSCFRPCGWRIISARYCPDTSPASPISDSSSNSTTRGAKDSSISPK